MKILFTAAEIARMRLPGLPTTKSSILARAAKEGWRYEEQCGIGGIRRAFEIPAHYLVSAHNNVTESLVRENPGKYRIRQVGNEGSASGAAAEVSLDTDKLAEAAHVLERWDSDECIGMAPDGKGRMIALLYKMLAEGVSTADLSDLLKDVTAAARNQVKG